MQDQSVIRDSARGAIRAATHADEAALVDGFLRAIPLSAAARADVAARAAGLVRRIRAADRPTLMESFLAEYGLSSEEGVGLMCLAEALLRVPDAPTIDALIADKIEPSDWGRHLGRSASSLVNAATWGLMLTGRLLDDDPARPAAALRAALRRLGEPVIRTAVARAMRLMGRQFVLGETIAEAMARAENAEARGHTHSYDMLGEAARTEADALRYHDAYADAIRAIAKRARGGVADSPGISVKLSALHPRYEWPQRDRVMAELLPRVRALAAQAARAGIGFNIDAEEADRLDLSLDVIAALMDDPELAGWDGLGVVVQAYGRRAGPVTDWLIAAARARGRRIMLRLVKGAYWDAEIKAAQVAGVPSFPVFTRKAATDVSYLALAARLLDARDHVLPQFATHNAHTAVAVLAMAGDDRTGFEFQRLHGMGETLHALLMAEEGTRCRIYAPVGAHRDLLAYLVRRLLENGANSSFVNRVTDRAVPPEDVAACPIAALERTRPVANPAIPAPPALYRPRINSRGFQVSEPASILPLIAGRDAWEGAEWTAEPIIPGHPGAGPERAVRNPARPEERVGRVADGDARAVAAALAALPAAQRDWARVPAAERATRLERAAETIEAAAPELIALLQREAGKTLVDAVAELREAVDFLRYYADAARTGPDRPRGPALCISPWNFPLAIFIGQVAAALAAGNAVVAKPAEATPLIAAAAVRLLHSAGIPEAALMLVPGDGGSVGASLTAWEGWAAVCFTGSTATARVIERQLAETAPEAVLIAETGGINAMIADSTALPEQVVRDVIASAFQSAGQRCSALRMLYVQDVALHRLQEMLTGAMDALVVGDPWQPSTDIGPVIGPGAQADIAAYLAQAAAEGRVIHRLPAPETGHFVGPALIRVPGIAAIPREVFGPVLHIAPFAARDLDRVVADVNATGYGLTFGLHSRIDARVERISARIRAGNIYVNRNQIGAVVGSQPFGGEGLSGTGPKAGGPHYLPRLRAEAEPMPPRRRPGGHPVASDGLRVPYAAAWAARTDRIAALAAALPPDFPLALEALRAAAALAEWTDLPGPTGESNRLRLVARGPALCLGAGADLALVQAVQALAAGAPAVLVAEGARAAALPLIVAGLPVVAEDGQIAPGALTELAWPAVVAARGPQDWLSALRRALAARSGPILTLETDAIAPARYVLERHLCIDTTAAGGNATLLVAGS